MKWVTNADKDNYEYLRNLPKKFTVGRPVPNPASTHTVADLERWGLVGIYEAEGDAS